MRICLNLNWHPRGVCQPLVAPKPLATHEPDEWYPYDDVPVGGVQVYVGLRVDISHACADLRLIGPGLLFLRQYGALGDGSRPRSLSDASWARKSGYSHAVGRR
jgi:hypothetical protein